MDLGLLFGILGTWALVIWALMSGGDIGIYIDVPSVIIVVGASVTITFFAFPARNVKGIMGAAKKAVFWKSGSIEKLIDDLVSYAEIARRDGILSLEATCREIDDPFVVQGLQMAVDGTDPELIEQILLSDLDTLVDRHDIGKGLFETINKYVPGDGHDRDARGPGGDARGPVGPPAPSGPASPSPLLYHAVTARWRATCSPAPWPTASPAAPPKRCSTRPSSSRA